MNCIVLISLVVVAAVIIWIWLLVKEAFEIVMQDEIAGMYDKVQCPACKGVCGVNVADIGEHADWYDCDFCDATGQVSLEKAERYAEEVRSQN